MAGSPQVEAADLDDLVAFIQESGEPQSLEDLCLHFIELLRQRAIAEVGAT